MADSIAKFFDRDRRPPRGGWHYPTGSVQVEKYSEPDLFAAVKKWRQNNQTFVSDLDIEREIWNYFCNREPDRCKPAMAEHARQVASLGTVTPREVTKELQGPPMWTFLNTLAVQWTPGLHDYFLHTCDAFLSMLVCPICRDEWRALLQKNPPVEIDSRLRACHWVNWAHNKVNERLGKQPYAYANMVTEFGAPLS